MVTSLDYYKTFYYVAKYGNITAAAERLGSEQPNVTRGIKNLERDLKCVLFTRSNKGVKLTPEGEKLYRHIAVAYEHIKAGEEELELFNKMVRGVVRVGASETALHEVLLSALTKYHKLYPEIHINLFNFNNVRAVEALKTQSVDFVLIANPFEEPGSLVSTKIKQIKDIAVCGSSYKEITEKPLTFKQISRYPIVSLNKMTKTFEFYKQLFAKHGAEFNPNVEISTADQILPIVKHELGIGFLPESFAQEAIANGEVFELKLAENIPLRDIYLVKRGDCELSVAAKALENVLVGSDERVDIK